MLLVDIMIQSNGLGRGDKEPVVTLCLDGFGVCCQVVDPNGRPLALVAVEINEDQLQRLADSSDLLSYFQTHHTKATKTLREFVESVTESHPASTLH